jgi:hypothetical protein
MQQKMNVSIKSGIFPSVRALRAPRHVDEYFEMRRARRVLHALVAPVRDQWRTSLSGEDRHRMEDRT